MQTKEVLKRIFIDWPARWTWIASTQQRSYAKAIIQGYEKEAELYYQIIKKTNGEPSGKELEYTNAFEEKFDYGARGVSG